MKSITIPFAIALLLATTAARAQDAKQNLDDAFADIEPKVIAWRRDLHQNPELSNREFRTAAKVAEHLRNLGFDD